MGLGEEARMRILERTITLPSWDTELRIIPFGCVHADTDGFAASLWKECLDDIMQPHTYAIGAGDYLDAVRTHARNAINEYRARGEDSQTPDQWAMRAYTEFYEKSLQRIRDKILFIGKGNHLWDFTTGKSSDMLLAELCQCPYGDKPTFLRLRISLHNRIIKTFKVLVHHEGGGGGGYARHGTDVNAAETKLYQFGAFDIVIFSHTHRKWGLTIPDLDLPDRGELRLAERTRALIRTGCFTRSYDVKCLQHYAHKKLLPPTELGYVTLKIRFMRNYHAERYEKRRALGDSPERAGNNAKDVIGYRMKLEF